MTVGSINNITTKDWEQKVVGLRFNLGGITLLQANFNVFRWTAPFAKVDTPLREPPRLEELSQGMDGFFLRGCPVDTALVKLTTMGKMLRYVPFQYDHYYTDLSGGTDAYLRHFSRQSLRKIRRRIRDLQAFGKGQMRMEEFTNPAQIEQFLADSAQIAAKTYQVRLLKTGLTSSSATLERIRRHARDGQALGFVLYLNDLPIAFDYSFVRNGIVFGDYLGYDPQYARWSPGTVLTFMIFERLFKEGRYRFFDHGQGEGYHKQLFSTGSVRCADIYYLRNLLRNRLVITLHCACDGIAAGLARTMAATNIKGPLKRLVRRHIQVGMLASFDNFDVFNIVPFF